MRRFRLGHFCVLLACFGAGGCTVPAAHAQLPLVQTGPLTFAPLVRRVVPAVVNIAVRMNITDSTAAAAMPPELKGTPFEKTFRDKLKARHEQMIGAGSGFVLDPSGIIVTNNHVVGNADKILVSFTDGTELPAHIIGTDELTDIAVIKVEPDHELPAVQWGDSHAVQVGDWVLAAGNPFGLGGSVTAGIVSARGRDIGAGPFDDFFQLDAPINPGNSGGPSFNMAGQVIALNTAIVSPTGGSVGIGFAIPSEIAQTIVEELLTKGHVDRGWLGVVVDTSTRRRAGAAIAEVNKGGPAARAGLRAGDLVTSINGARVESTRELVRAVSAVNPGAVARLRVRRGNQTVEVAVVVGKRPPEQPQVEPDQ
jgi:serine protease Do